MPCVRDYLRLKWTGERLSRGRASRFSRFLSIGCFGGGLWQVSRGVEIGRFDGCESGSTESPERNSWTAEQSGWIYEAEQFFLGLPTQREIATTGGQKLRGEFRGLAAFGNALDDRGREKSQANHATDVALADAITLADFNHRSRATRYQIIKPAVSARRRLQDG
jgi:hypothetical protein